MDIKTIDHILLTVRDIKATLDFYQTILDKEVGTLKPPIVFIESVRRLKNWQVNNYPLLIEASRPGIHSRKKRLRSSALSSLGTISLA